MNILSHSNYNVCLDSYSSLPSPINKQGVYLVIIGVTRLDLNSRNAQVSGALADRMNKLSVWCVRSDGNKWLYYESYSGLQNIKEVIRYVFSAYSPCLTNKDDIDE